MPEILIRNLVESDLFEGFLDSLDSLRSTRNLDHEKAMKIFQAIKSNPNHIIVAAILREKVVGSATLLIEPKFIHEGGLVGHIEDVVVSKKYQKKGIGKELIKYLLEYSRTKGCYKTILDCDEEIRSFYEKIGFKRTTNGMRFDHV